MQLRHIRYLIAAAEEEHFGKAAERLCVTRSAVSQLVADLENEWEIALFERQAQKIKLTAAGRAMLPRLKDVMLELEQIVDLGKRVGQGKSGQLIVGYGSLSTHHPIFREAVKRYHQDYPDVVLTLVEIPTSRQMHAMREGEIHAGFMHIQSTIAQSAAKSNESHSQVIDKASLGLIVPKDHRLARKGSAQLRDLAGEQLVMTHNWRESPAFGGLFSLCRSSGFEPRVIQEVSATVTQQDLVSVGVGIGVSVIGGMHTYPPEISVIAITDVDYDITFQLSHMYGRVEPVLDTFINVVQQCTVGQISASE